MARPLHADKRADELNAQYKDALSRGQTVQAIDFICEAAQIEPKKYEKKCSSAKQHANDELKAFEGFYNAGQAAMQQKDYSGAIKTLSKITFGARKDDAQRLIQDANSVLNHPRDLATDKITMAATQAAYAHGDLAVAAAGASQVKVAEFQPAAQQILTNIHIYQDAINSGDSAMNSGNFQAAAERFKFALAIVPNGPGNPTGKLQYCALQISMAASASPAKKASGSNPKQSAPQPPSTDALRVKTALAEAHAAESKKDFAAGIAAYDRVLAINPKQIEAVAGKQRLLSAMPHAPEELEKTLIAGLHSYYQFHFIEANDFISLYLSSGGTLHKGTAYFYLGAILTTQSLLAGPDKDGSQPLQTRALQQFNLARCEHYSPVEKYVSPKILSLWNKSACAA